ncbi:staphylopine uptake ABC transporter permease subunit CntC [Cohnella thailandensis]|uniref:ABC transporter permease subunit n=1 Tax=Cohnella thailandensis TaxID=557557 RepID=A0A841SX76_9BACL|nr:nickel/cobalt ABC transporter permease [Cohnella thailandensis]MBB6633351.1 ABC transporter permease subunit [Cohnella thailandensis]MBP1977307.1 nickel transport system permease protein [Cohnella thailandensis]
MRRFHYFLKDKLAALSLAIISITVIAGIFAPWIAPNDPEEVHMELRFASASWEYLLGNDHLGRCILSRLIYGIRPSVLWVLVALVASVGIGAVIGFIAGYFKGRIDAFLMRICDVMLSFPGYVMTLAIIGILGVGLENILLAFVLMKWAWFARIIRTSVMAYAESDYVKFSKVLGMGSLRIMRKHILPVSLPDIAVTSSSAYSSMVLQLSGFSFLGLGIQAPHAEWGMMLNEAREVMFSRPEMMLAPGITTILFVTAVNFFTDSLQVALDPKLGISGKKRQGRPDSVAGRIQRNEVA